MYLIKLAAMTVLVGAQIFGQNVAVQRVYHPDDVIRLQVTFEGPNIADLRWVSIQLYGQQLVAKDQPGFENQLSGGDSKRISENTFETSFKIPQNAATGDYKLVLAATVPGRSLRYESPKDFKEEIFHIDNPSHFESPKIKSVTIK